MNVGSSRHFRYQHAGVDKAKCSRWAQEAPTQVGLHFGGIKTLY